MVDRVAAEAVFRTALLVGAPAILRAALAGRLPQAQLSKAGGGIAVPVADSREEAAGRHGHLRFRVSPGQSGAERASPAQGCCQADKRGSHRLVSRSKGPVPSQESMWSGAARSTVIEL